MKPHGVTWWQLDGKNAVMLWKIGQNLSKGFKMFANVGMLSTEAHNAPPVFVNQGHLGYMKEENL